MHRAFHGATLAGALVFLTSLCWTQSWAQDQGRPPAPPALVGMGLPEVPPEQVGMSKQKLDRIHDVLKQQVADGKLPGTVVLVARKGKLIYADVTGFQDKDEGKPMALDSVFRIYSMTKPLVSVAAMILVDDGTIELTDAVWRVRAYGDFLSYCLVAEGAVDIAAEPEVSVWDLAALDILVREAGGLLTSLDGTAGPHRGSAVATNGLLQQQVLARLTGG